MPSESKIREVIEVLGGQALSTLEELKQAVRDEKSPDEVAALALLYGGLLLLGERTGTAGELGIAIENLKAVKPGMLGGQAAKRVYEVAFFQLCQLLDHVKANSAELRQMIREAVGDN